MYRIGIMQGRLSPPTDGRIQSFPVSTWRQEFFAAREAGLYCIEWVYEAGTDGKNPLGSQEGIDAICDLVRETGIRVDSVCADYYMKERIIEKDGSVNPQVASHFLWLANQVRLLGGRYMVLPFVDSSSMKTQNAREGLLRLFRSVRRELESLNVEIHLETDFEPKVLAEMLREIDNPLVRANYDIGNAASLGHPASEELPLIGSSLGSVHVKDRLLGGTTVPLGKGSADFRTCFELFKTMGYRGSFVLQAAREEGLTELALALRNRRFVEDLLVQTAGRA